MQRVREPGRSVWVDTPGAARETPPVTIHRLEIESRADLADALAVRTAARLEAWLDMRPAAVRTRKVFHLELWRPGGTPVTEEDARAVLEALVDPVAEVGAGDA